MDGWTDGHTTTANIMLAYLRGNETELRALPRLSSHWDWGLLSPAQETPLKLTKPSILVQKGFTSSPD